MEFDKTCKIHKAAGERSRYAIDSVQFEGGEDSTGCLVATNGKIVAVVPVTDCAGESAGLLPIGIFPEACKGKKTQPARIIALDDAVACNGTSMKRDPDAGRFPDWRNAIPKDPGENRLCIDVKQLVKLAAALGSDEIELRWSDPVKNSRGKLDWTPLTARPINGVVITDGPYGAIMPMGES